MVDLATRAGVERIVLNGSFVTDSVEPNDVDCVMLVGTRFLAGSEAANDLRAGLPFLDLELVELTDFVMFVDQIFQSDRNGVPKGLVELIL